MTEVLQPAARAQRAGGPGRSILWCRSRAVPWFWPGTVGRPSLIERLARDDCGPVVSVVAPGHGKTTLLSQWAERNAQAFAWVSVDESG